MVRKRTQNAISVLTTLSIMLVLLSTTGLAVRKSYAIAIAPPAPSWLTAGNYMEYNQTYTIGALTASVNVKDTVLNVSNGAADVRIERFGPQIPSGFPEPGLAAAFDSGNESHITTVISSANGTRTIIGGSGFTTDLTMFVSQDWLSRLNTTFESVHVLDSGSATVQAWRVDETTLYRFIGGAPVPSGALVNPSFVWFEKDTLMKVRESYNYTDPSNNYVVSVETMEDTNIPQLESALTPQESYVSQPSSSLLSSLTGAVTQSPVSAFDAVLAAVIVVTVVVMAFYFAKANRHA